MGPILGPDPHCMDPKIGPKISPGRILIKPEALLRDIGVAVCSDLRRLGRVHILAPPRRAFGAGCGPA